jgi:hypothetical protein
VGRTVTLLLLCQSVALLGQAVAVVTARGGDFESGLTLSFVSLAVTVGSAVAVLVRSDLTRAARNCAVVCLGLTTTLQWRALDPLVFTGFDEQLHVRTLTDVLTSHGLFEPHPLLRVSPHYPGLESLTALLVQAGVPAVVAGTAVVLVARLVLVLALCDAVEQVSGSARAGGLAVAVYSISPQFVFFNSQFSYQTLALPLAVTAVALIGRVRHSPHGRLLMAGVFTCLLAVAVSHHVTSLLTAVFLLLWAAVSRGGRSVRRTRLAAVLAVAATATWALVQWTLLRDYFVPIINDLAGQLDGSGGSSARRRPFTNASGTVTPPWEQATLAFYAVTLSLATGAAVLAGTVIVVRHRRPTSHAAPGLVEPTPQKLVIALAAMVPLIFLLRLTASGGEFGDRATSFLYLPLGYLIGTLLVQAARQPRLRRHRRLAQVALPPLVAVMFIGGYLLGSGPDWQRLPGSYLPSADSRSMDSETLAAVRWAATELPPGTRVAADRVGAVVLSGEARLWPVFREGQLDASSLFFAEEWGQSQTDLVRELRLQYLYVDERLSTGLPHVGSYFFRGETDEPVRLTAGQLTKFESVPGIRVAYRHGPVTVYDLIGLGVPVERTGWTGDRAAPGAPWQVLAGLIAAGALLAVARSPAGPAVTRAVSAYRRAAGPSLTFGTALAGLTVLAVTALLLHVWLGPLSFAVAALVVLGVTHRTVGRWLRAFGAAGLGVARRLRWPEAALLCAAVGIVVVSAVLVVTSAHEADIAAVERILSDPTTITEVAP